MDKCCPAREGDLEVRGDSKAGRAVTHHPPPASKGTGGHSPTALEQGEQSTPRTRSRLSCAPEAARQVWSNEAQSWRGAKWRKRHSDQQGDQSYR